LTRSRTNSREIESKVKDKNKIIEKPLKFIYPKSKKIRPVHDYGKRQTLDFSDKVPAAIPQGKKRVAASPPAA